MVVASATLPAYFTPAQHEFMGHVLNRLVPASGDFPGAGALYVVDYLERVVAPSAALKRLFTQGLAQIAVSSQARYAHSNANFGFIRGSGLPIDT